MSLKFEAKDFPIDLDFTSEDFAEVAQSKFDLWYERYKKQQCQHEPAMSAAGNYEPACWKCNAKLRFTWVPE